MSAGEETGKTASENHKKADGYWRANLSLLFTLLVIWFVVSFGFGILLRPILDEFVIFGFKLGFWFAQQGSIFVFMVLIFVYAAKMRKLDREYGVED